MYHSGTEKEADVSKEEPLEPQEEIQASVFPDVKDVLLVSQAT